MNILNFLRDNVIADQISRNREGNIVFRRSYYYRHGQDAQSFANYIQQQLQALNLNAQLVHFVDNYRNFRGGASIANSSHFYAEFQIAK